MTPSPQQRQQTTPLTTNSALSMSKAAWAAPPGEAPWRPLCSKAVIEKKKTLQRALPKNGPTQPPRTGAQTETAAFVIVAGTAAVVISIPPGDVAADADDVEVTWWRRSADGRNGAAAAPKPSLETKPGTAERRWRRCGRHRRQTALRGPDGEQQADAAKNATKDAGSRKTTTAPRSGRREGRVWCRALPCQRRRRRRR